MHHLLDFLHSTVFLPPPPKKEQKIKNKALLKGNRNKVIVKHSQQLPFHFSAGDEVKRKALKRHPVFRW